MNKLSMILMATLATAGLQLSADFRTLPADEVRTQTSDEARTMPADDVRTMTGKKPYKQGEFRTQPYRGGRAYTT